MTSSPSPDPLAELKRLLESGQIDQATHDQLAAGLRMQAQLTGSGAIAQGTDAVAVATGGVMVRGDNSGAINVWIQKAAQSGASAQDLRLAYLAHLLRQADQLPLSAGDGGSGHVRLSSVYTGLLTQRSEGEPSLRSGMAPDTKPRHLSAVEVLNAEPRLVLLGGPGSGKSSFVSFVALSMAGELLAMPHTNLVSLTVPLPKDAGSDNEPTAQRWDHAALLPVHVVLRDLASQLPDTVADITADTLWKFIKKALNKCSLPDYGKHLKRELLERGGLILLDGLDEVPDALKRREQVKQAVQQFAAAYSKCRFLITSRTYAYQQQDWKLDGFAEVPLLPFTRGQIDRFVDAWYGHMVELERLTRTAADSRADVLKREVGRNPRIRELAERPLLLTLVAQLQARGSGALPPNREALYDKAVEMLLDTWEGMKPRFNTDGSKFHEPSLSAYLNTDKQAIRAQLNRLAFEAHCDQPLLNGTADIAEIELFEALRKAGDADVKPTRLAEYLRDRAGILSAHGEGLYQFPHRSFQEYLAACHLTDDDFPDQLAELVRTDANRWREVLLLAAAKAARDSKHNAWTLAEELCSDEPPGPEVALKEADHWAALLAGQVLVECADLNDIAKRDQPKHDRIRQWQVTIMRRNTLPAVERALAGRSLAVLGDPRPEVMTLDGMQFCLVPPGPFVMGDDQSSDREKPQHTVDLDYAYFIARFPVTVAQWRGYLGYSGNAPDDERSIGGRSNDPVVNVNWHDALRLCNALTETWRKLLPEGFVVMLPSEAEWEKAARGGIRIPADHRWLALADLKAALAACPSAPQMPNPFSRRSYPWGNVFDTQKANADSHIGLMTAAGCYPAGDSPYGCEDMAGNVREWTRSLWGADWVEPQFRYPYQITDARRESLGAGDEVLRLVRGGAFGLPADDARCAARIGFHPVVSVGGVGFRVVLRAAAVLQVRTPWAVVAAS